MVYAYVTLGKQDCIDFVDNGFLDLLPFFLGYISEDNSFNALLRAQPIPRDQEPILSIPNNNFFNNTFDETIEQR